MAHPQQLQFFKLVKRHILDHPEQNIPRLHIIEIGSFNVNGSIRDFVQTKDVEYLGVDLCEGKGVDLVSYGHEVDQPNSSFHAALSGECFEHDPKWQETFSNMYRMTIPGGVVAFTCATTGRLEHGTIRAGADQSPGTQFIGLDYYKNLTEKDFQNAFDIGRLFTQHHFFYEPTSHDLYFVGIKTGSPQFKMDVKAFLQDVKQINSLHKIRFKIIDIPIYIARHIFDEQEFQDFSCTYLSKVRPIRAYIKSIGRRKSIA